ncbi:MAG: TadE/TadG family type IV pilus assembly protein [Acidobacteriota bacterium]
MLKKLRDEAGQAIAEFAVMLPVFALVGFCIVDIQWMTKQAANIDYIVNEVAHCEALAETTPSAPLPCQPSTGGVSPHQYALNLAQNLRVGGPSLTVNTPNCNTGTGVCTVSIQYGYKPLGAWFPSITISRNGTASYSPPPPLP